MHSMYMNEQCACLDEQHVWQDIYCTYPSLSLGGSPVDGSLNVRGLPFEYRQKGINKWLKVCMHVDATEDELLQ